MSVFQTKVWSMLLYSRHLERDQNMSVWAQWLISHSLLTLTISPIELALLIDGGCSVEHLKNLSGIFPPTFPPIISWEALQLILSWHSLWPGGKFGFQQPHLFPGESNHSRPMPVLFSSNIWTPWFPRTSICKKHFLHLESSLQEHRANKFLASSPISYQTEIPDSSVHASSWAKSVSEL